MAVRRRLNRGLILAAKVAVAAALFTWLVKSGALRPQEIVRAIRRSPLWLGFALLMCNVAVLLAANRWRLLLLPQGLSTSRRDCVMMTYIGSFFSCFLPGSAGGDVAKAYYVARDSERRAEAATTVFVDRLLGLYCMVGFAAVAVLFRVGRLWHYEGAEGARTLLLGLTRAQLLVLGVPAAFVVATLGVLVFLSPHCRRFVHSVLGRLPHSLASPVKRIYEAVYLYRGQKRVLLGFVLYSVSGHGLLAVSLWVVGLSLNDPVATGGARALNYLFLIPLGLVLNGLPIAPAGVGVFEWALGFLFGAVLVAGEPNVGASIAALGHILFILTSLIGLVFYLKFKRRGVCPGPRAEPMDPGRGSRGVH